MFCYCSLTLWDEVRVQLPEIEENGGVWVNIESIGCRALNTDTIVSRYAARLDHSAPVDKQWGYRLL